MRLTLRLGSGLKLTGAFVPRLNNLYLTANNVSEAVTGGSTVGTLTFGQTSGSTFTLIDNASGQFALSGLNINTATLIDVAVDTFYNITVREANPAFTPNVRDSVISIKVTSGGVAVVGMEIGLNLGFINSYTGGQPFANLMHVTSTWERSVGSGSFTQDQGSIVASAPTDQFRLYLSDQGDNLTAGTYTVYNPSGAEIGFGGFSGQELQAFTTATTFTFNYVSGPLFLHCKGSLPTTSGNLAIIIPGHTVSWAGGDVFNSAFISYLQGLSPRVLRFMDWGNASGNVESAWANRTQLNKINFSNYHGGGGAIIPYEIMFDLSNRIGADPWICTPTRADQNYINQFAALAATKMNASRKLYTEHSNETWNYGYPWSDGANWIEYLDHTRRTATANSVAGTYTLAAHGLSNGADIVSFTTVENRAAVSELAINWRVRSGANSYVEVVDANTFKLHGNVGLSELLPVATGQVNLLFVVKAEAGKIANAGQHNAELCVRNWDALDVTLGASRVEHIITAQAASSNVASLRINALSAPNLARVDAISPAPYFDTFWFGGAVDISTGQLLPKFWGNRNGTVHVGIYAAGSTPNVAAVIAGTGAINKQVINYTAGADTFTNGVAVTGLTNGTTYSVQIVVVGADNYEWAISANAVVSATLSTVDILEPHAQTAKRGRIGAELAASYITSHQALLPADIICYEGGSHDFQNAPLAVRTWNTAYWSSSIFGGVVTNYLETLASVGCKLHCYFSEVTLGVGGVFGLADTHRDTTDGRYVAVAAFNGLVTPDPLVITDIIAANILTAPAYPYTVHTFANATLTYSLLNGDNNGNFAVVGNELRLINGTGIDFGAPLTRTVTIEASNGSMSDFFNVTFATGDAWYAGDALFAWDSIADTDGAIINPVIGNTLPRINGTGATIASGLWDMEGTNRYGSNAALASSLDLTKPLLFAAVLDRDNHTGSYVAINQLAAGGFVATMYVVGSPEIILSLYANGSGADLNFGVVPTGKHVLWFYVDPVTDSCRVGYDQTENVAAALTKDVGGSSSTELHIGGSNASAGSNMKHGSVQVVNRTGLTFAQALALVQKMQTLHGI